MNKMFKYQMKGNEKVATPLRLNLKSVLLYCSLMINLTLATCFFSGLLIISSIVNSIQAAI